MSIKAIATIIFAASFAAAKPINSHSAVSLNKRQIDLNSVVNGLNINNGGFNFIDGFNNFNQQERIVQIQQQNVQIVDDRSRQQILQQAQQVLIVDQVNNGFNNDLNNLFRKSNFANRFRDVRTTMLVVQEIVTVIDDGRGNRREQSIFAQNVVVANRNGRQQQTVMIFDSRKLIAQDILSNNAFDKLSRVGGIAGATGSLNKSLPLKTKGYQLFDAKPSWANVEQDPAGELGAIWQAALQDLQDAKNDDQDNKLNEQLAEQEKKALEDAKNKQDAADKKAADQKAADAQKKADDQKKADEQKAADDAAKKAADQKAADEQKAADAQKDAQGQADQAKADDAKAKDGQDAKDAKAAA
ncbi:hypothetical protein yc1106_07575 [Curvularia clavata]|uniref:Uncharacterized protein n=1 Tax=Curvularia clavata TaxID=95742 RepID=A0A9Q9DWB7_CURCL|nr:hypothetical protein yc1106_07575 [Curvularia clavata]